MYDTELLYYKILLKLLTEIFYHSSRNIQGIGLPATSYWKKIVSTTSSRYNTIIDFIGIMY